MKISVWDTYVKRSDGSIMHFDILTPDVHLNMKELFGYGQMYLESKPFTTEKLSSEKCSFCHIEEASPAIIHDIEKKGFSIVELENCN